MIADYTHLTTYLTFDLNKIFAQTKPTAAKVSALPYPKSIDATGSLQ